MIQRIHQRLGTAGFVISIVALTLALTGGAYAAGGGLSGKQKKEVTKIAQTEARKLATAGPAGAAGTTGPAGAPGAKGDPGSAGVGTPGEAGKSVTSEEFGAGGKEGHCVGVGGTKFAAAAGPTFACNGKVGSPWTAGGVLPAGATETGTFGAAVAAGGVAFIPVSLSIPTAAPLTAIYVTGGKEFDTGGQEVTGGRCPGITAGVPEAEPGALCAYATTATGTQVFQGLFDPTKQLEPGAAVTGALVATENQAAGEGVVAGVFAATAE
jgi:pilus assembly protein FimV